MISFSVSIENMFNIVIIAAGIGVCGMNILQVGSGAHLREQVKRYFQLFFGIVILYIGCHLARQLMEGFPGAGIGFSIRAVTLLEFLASGVMAFLFSELTLYIADPDKGRGVFQKLFRITLALYVVLMVVSSFTGLCYYFEASNVYHHGSAYLLSNLTHVVMLVTDVYLLTRNRDNFNPQVRRAFWLYIVSPIAAIAIQAFIHNILLLSLQQYAPRSTWLGS